MGASRRIRLTRKVPCRICGGAVISTLEADYDWPDGPGRARWWTCKGCGRKAPQRVRKGKEESSMKVDNCRSCGARILWAETTEGKRMPLDEVAKKGVVVVLGRAQVVDVYTSHFATCPKANEHRGVPR